MSEIGENKKVLIKRGIESKQLITTKWKDWRVVENNPTAIRLALRDFRNQFDPFRRKSKNKKTWQLSYVSADYVIVESTFKTWILKRQKSGEQILNGIADKQVANAKRRELQVAIPMNLDF